MRVLRWVLLVLVLVVGALVALPFLVPTGVYKEQIIAQTQVATGRALEIDGDLKLSFWPAFGVEVGKVSFANAAGAATPQMVTMESMVVGAELMPLLFGTLNVTQVRFVNPTINLEIDKQGRGNWLFEAAQGAPAEGQAKPASGGDFRFRDIEIKGGTLTYADARTGTAQRIDGIDVSVKLPSLDQPMAILGGLTWNKEAITVDATIANPRALSTGGKSELKSKIDGEVLNATFDGTIDAAKSEIAGDVDFKTQSARRLAAWAGVELPNVRGFGAMTLKGALSSTAAKIAFKEAKLSLDGMNGAGNLVLDTSGARPHAQGDFTLDRLDLNPYLGSGAEAQGGAAAGTSAWSDGALDFSALRSVDADLDFAVNALSVGGMKIGRSALDIALNGGKLRANLKQMALYGGNGSGVISLNGADGAPQVVLDLNFADVQGEPFLTDAAGFTRLSGTGNIALKVAAAGSSQRALMKALDGTMQITFTDGAIKGVNLAEIARTIQSALSGTATGPAAKTDFAELSGSFVFRDGVGANKDLKLLNPFVRLTGAGIVDVGNQTLDYRVEPKAVRSAEGQGGQGNLGGIGIPFRIKGPWSKLSYAPDLSGVLDSTVDSILKGGDPLESLKDGSGLGDLLGGKKKPPPGTQPPKPDPNKKKDSLDPLKGLFGQ